MDEKLLTFPQVSSVRSLAYEPVYALAEHTPDHSELIHVIDGPQRLSVGGRRYAAGPGDTLLAPCDQPHRDLFDLTEGLDVLLVLVMALRAPNGPDIAEPIADGIRKVFENLDQSDPERILS